MKITEVKVTGKYCLNVVMQNGDVLELDCIKSIKDAFRKNNKELVRISENFNSAHVSEGNLAFYCGADELYISADEVASKGKLISKGKSARTCHTSSKKHTDRYLGTLGTISSREVMETEANRLPFTGAWRDFLGEPAPNFYMILSAQPGHGKSTFCLKFGNYLTRFGSVLYITNEEDAARIKSKMQFINDKINDFDIAFEAKTLDDVINLIDRGNYDTVFIDSAQYGGMDYKELRIIRERFPEIRLIAICRQTKSGSSRGSQEKEYDGDITIKFDAPGHARTVKNRFWELSEFQLF